jgi:hypothetical protein
MFEGTTIKMGGKEYVVPPLNLARLKKALPLLESLKTADLGQPGSLTMDQTDTIVKVILLSLSRNYPDLTVEEVEEAVDLGNLMQVIPAIMGVSGLIKQGETVAGSA